MQSLEEIRHRAKSIEDIRHITKAMNMLSAIRLKQAERRIADARPFAQRITEVLVDIAGLVGGKHHPLMAERTGGRSAFVLFTSDRGLCGPFNDNIVEAAFQYIEQHALSERADFLVVGGIGRGVLRDRGVPIVHEYLRPGKQPTFSLARSVAADVSELFVQQRIDEAFLVFSRYYSSIEQHPRLFRLLPIVPLELGEQRRSVSSSGDALVFEPSAEAVLGHLVPRYVETAIYRALLESYAGEQAARMTAMGAATDNADKMIDELTVLYNQSRQSEVTSEINEIVGGSEALLEEGNR